MKYIFNQIFNNTSGIDKNESFYKEKSSRDSRIKVDKFKFGVQSFTSLKADLPQDINGVLNLAGALMEHFLEGSSPIRLW